MNGTYDRCAVEPMPTNDGRANMLAPSLREVFDRASAVDARYRVNAQTSIYATGDEDESLYLIDSGQVKLSMASAGGKDCLLAIYTKGEVVGESCFTDGPRRCASGSASMWRISRARSRSCMVRAFRGATGVPPGAISVPLHTARGGWLCSGTRRHPRGFRQMCARAGVGAIAKDACCRGGDADLACGGGGNSGNRCVSAQVRECVPVRGRHARVPRRRIRPSVAPHPLPFR